MVFAWIPCGNGDGRWQYLFECLNADHWVGRRGYMPLAGGAEAYLVCPD